MKKQLIVTVLCVVIGLFFLNFKGSPGVKSLEKKTGELNGKAMQSPEFGNVPLYFVKNGGQVDRQVRYYAAASRYTLWLTERGFVFDAFGKEKKSKKSRDYRDVTRLTFVKANKHPEMAGEQITGHRVNVLKGKNPSAWQTNIPTSAKVKYKSVYKNVDLLVYGVEKEIEYDWIVKPGGNHNDIAVRFDGAVSSAVDKKGNLVIKTKNGEWIHQRPIAFQEIDGQTVAVNSSYKKINAAPNTFGFSVGKYDKNHPLIIDPMVVAFCSYLGGSGWDTIEAVTLDASGSAVVTGLTGSSDFPIMGGVQGTLAGESDVYIAKFTADGKGLVFSTYFGGSSTDDAKALVIANGSIYIGGYTMSSDFPVLNAYQSTKNGYMDGFVAKFSADGSTLQYSTYFGGTQDEMIRDLEVNGTGEVIVAGFTGSSDLPLQSALYTSFNNGVVSQDWESDGFITKFSASGSSLVFSTYIGGEKSDDIFGLALNAAGDVYGTGQTYSDDFPVSADAYQASMGYNNDPKGVIFRISSDGSTLVYSTFFGGSDQDVLWDIALDAAGAIYVTGESSSTNYPTTAGAYQSANPTSTGMDAVITKMSADGSSLVFSTYLNGTNGYTGARAIALGGDGSVYVTGNTSSTNFPVVSPIQEENYGFYNIGFISHLTPDGSSLTFSTYYGGGEYFSINDIAVDGSGSIFIGGSSDGGVWAYQGYQTTPGGGDDGFITKIVFDQYNSLTVTSPNGGENLIAGSTTNITWTAPAVVSRVNIDFVTYDDYYGSYTSTPIVENAPNTGSYSWSIPSDMWATGKIYIVDADMGGYGDESDADIEITPYPLQLTAPNGGETMQVGNIYNIEWNNFIPMEYISIEFSADGGAAWTPVATSIANSGMYAWTVPDAISANCLIRVSEAGGAYSDVSNGTFAIEGVPVGPMIPQAERDALIALYNSTNGDSWTNNTNWRKPGDPSQFNDRGTENTWFGVTCNAENTQVTRLNLSRNNLSGTLPTELNDLVNLTYINLYYNTISGSIPDIGNLTGMTYLNLSYNRLSGSVPASLNNLTALTNITLYRNQLSGSLPDLSALTNLTYVNFYYNQLSGNIPAYFNNFVNLRTLDLQYNQFSGPIPDLSALTNLTYLNLYRNQLTGSIPTWFNNLNQLSTFYLGYNQLSGPIPDLSGMTKVRSMNLSYNNFSGSLPDFTGMTSLTYLYLNNNNFTGSIPASLNNLTALRYLYLHYNDLSGSIPDLSNLTAMYYLKFSNNDLSGEIPASIGGMAGIRYLYFDNNHLEGNLPSELGNLTQLRYLYLNGNKFEGEIPSSFYSLVNLYNNYGLKISYNALYTGDASLANFLNSKHSGFWETTQTLAPDPVTVGTIEDHSVALSWQPIEYTSVTGGYWVYVSTTPGTGYELAEVITSKNTTSCTVSDLAADTDYYFIVKSYTNSHTYNPNVVFSGASPEVTAKTTGGGSAALTSPNGGEVWNDGTYQSITWTSTVADQYVKLQYSTDNGTTWQVIDSMATNNGAYAWQVPNAPSNQCLVKISDTLEEKFEDVSDAVFTIQDSRSITVTQPNGGEIIPGNTTYTIKFDITGTINNVKIEYSLDAGSTWNLITASHLSGYDYYWPVPNTPSTNCLIKVTDTASTISDTSNAVFTIQEGESVALTSPVGGETYETSSYQTITWTTTGNIQDVKIQYSYNHGSTWLTVESSIPNTGTYNWTVTNVPSSAGGAYIRVTDANGTEYDNNDTGFTVIQCARSIDVVTPTHDTVWQAGTQQTIVWTSSGDINNVSIEYSTDGGATYTMITASTPNTGSFNWTVPNTPSTDCHIRVKDLASVIKDSNAFPFTITN